MNEKTYNTVLTWQLIAYLAWQLLERVDELPKEEYDAYMNDSDFRLETLIKTAEQRAAYWASQPQEGATR